MINTKTIGFLFIFCSILTGCGSPYNLKSFRREGISIEQLKTKNFEVKEAAVSYTQNNEWRKFNLPEQKYLKAFKENFKLNFYPTGSSPRTVPNASILFALKIYDDSCETILPIIGQTGISSAYTTSNTYGSYSNYGTINATTNSTTTYTPTYGITGFMPVKEHYTHIAIAAIGYDNKGELFESILSFTGTILDDQGKNNKVLDMIETLTHHIGEERIATVSGGSKSVRAFLIGE